MVCSKLIASGGAAAVAGLALYTQGMQKPLWRAALVVLLAALAAYLGYSYVYPGECEECVSEDPSKKQKVN